MSLPSGTGRLRRCRHLQSEQLGQQDHTIAVRTRAAESHRASKQLACGATPLAERLLAATRALVHRARHEQSLALELHADDDRINVGQRLTTQPISELFTGRFAINGANARWPA